MAASVSTQQISSFQNAKSLADGVKQLRSGWSSQVELLNELSARLNIYVSGIQALKKAEESKNDLPDFETIDNSITWIKQKVVMTINDGTDDQKLATGNEESTKQAIQLIANDPKYKGHLSVVNEAIKEIAKILRPKARSLKNSEELLFWICNFGLEKFVQADRFCTCVLEHASNVHGYYKLTDKTLVDELMTGSIKMAIQTVMNIGPDDNVTASSFSDILTKFGPFDKLLEKACPLTNQDSGEPVAWFLPVSKHEEKIFGRNKIDFYIRYSRLPGKLVFQTRTEKILIENSAKGYLITGGVTYHPNIPVLLSEESTQKTINVSSKNIVDPKSQDVIWSSVLRGLKNATFGDGPYGAISNSGHHHSKSEKNKGDDGAKQMYETMNRAFELLGETLKTGMGDMNKKLSVVQDAVDTANVKLDKQSDMLQKIDENIIKFGLEILQQHDTCFPKLFIVQFHKDNPLQKHMEEAQFGDTWKRMTTSKYTVFVLCEGYGNRKKNTKGRLCHKVDDGYDIDVATQEFVNIAPYFTTALKVLSAAVKVEGCCGAGDVVEQAGDMLFDKLGMTESQIKKQMKKLEVLEGFACGKDENKDKEKQCLKYSTGLMDLLEDRYKKDDLTQGRAGDLTFSHVPGDERNRKWLCNDCIGDSNATIIKENLLEEMEVERQEEGCMLEVKILRAEKLYNTDGSWFKQLKNRGDASDPYVVIAPTESKQPVEPRQQTEIMPDNLNPEWNETFQWNLTGEEVEIVFEVWDDEKEERKKKRDNFLGMYNTCVKKGELPSEKTVELEFGESNEGKSLKKKLKKKLEKNPDILGTLTFSAEVRIGKVKKDSEQT